MKNIKFLEFRHLRGPNIWTYRPVIEAIVDIGELEDFPSNTLPGFVDRLKALLPSLIEHRCSYEERGGFVRRLEEGTWPAHILEHVTLELQNLAGLPGGFGKARETSVRGVYKVVVRAWQEDVTHAALLEARELIMSAIEDRPFDVEASIEKLADMADSLCLGPSTASIVDAADDRYIPCIRLLETGNLVQLGYGAAMRRIWTAETDRTSAIAEGISRDKDMTKSLLQSCGVPVPEGREVDSPEDAWEAAQDIGLPVCVKPVDGNHGRGVFIDLKGREEIEMAFKVAVDEGSGVLVERSIPGTEHRLLIIGGKLVAANRGDMVKVTGNGKSTILELVAEQINSDPRRGASENHPLSLIRMDSAAKIELSRQKLTPEAIPDAGREVLIQRNANHEFDVTDDVHPDTAAAASLAARIVGLDIAGVDLVVEDISKPLREQGGAIVEVNAGPGLLMHLKPGVGKPRPVGQAIVEHLFPDTATSRIPVVGITGSQGKTSVARLLAHLLQLSGKNVGLACSDGLFLGPRALENKDSANWQSAHRMLMARAVEAAVFENGAASILGEGLAYDRCQVGVVTNLKHAEGLEDFDVRDLDTVYKVLRTQIDVVLRGGKSVLNAGDSRVAEMAELSDGEVLFFGTDPELPVLTAHRAKNGRSVFIRDGWVALASGSSEQQLIQVNNLPMIAPQSPGYPLENLLAGVAAAWALELSPDIIRAGVATYVPASKTSGLAA
ncbi:MAG: cphA [Proteobacteria bacterium]|nr:cphA [Pseudomonadota bacterium]